MMRRCGVVGLVFRAFVRESRRVVYGEAAGVGVGLNGWKVMEAEGGWARRLLRSKV